MRSTPTWYGGVDGVVQHQESAFKQGLQYFQINNYLDSALKSAHKYSKTLCKILIPEHWSWSRTCKAPEKLRFQVKVWKLENLGQSMKIWKSPLWRSHKVVAAPALWSRQCSCTENTGSENSLGHNTWWSFLNGRYYHYCEDAYQCPWTRRALLRKWNLVKAKSEAWAAAVPSSPAT